MTEETEFCLTNRDVEQWTETQFWESDPFNNNGDSLRQIFLYVDFEKKYSEVEAVVNNGSIPKRLFDGLARRFYIPFDADFSKFEEFYNNEIKPVLLSLAEEFTIIWNGSNDIGRFTGRGKVIEYNIDVMMKGAPRHDRLFSFDVQDAFGSAEILNDYLDSYGIDFVSADLTDEETLIKVIDAIEDGEVVIINMSRKNYENELIGMQNELKAADPIKGDDGEEEDIAGLMRDEEAFEEEEEEEEEEKDEKEIIKRINKHDVFKIAEKYAEERFGKKSVAFSDEEEEHYLGYIAGLLKGLRLAGAEVEDL